MSSTADPSSNIGLPSAPGPANPGDSKMGVIIGGTIGGVLLVLAVALVVVILQKRKHKKEVPKRQMAHYNPSHNLSSRNILMGKEGYSTSHHPTNSDLVGMMPLLGGGWHEPNEREKAKYYLSTSDHHEVSPSAPTFPSTQPNEDFNPYTAYQGNLQPNSESMAYHMPPRPPQDVHARSTFTQHIAQARGSPRLGSPRALPLQPGSPRSPSIRPLPIPVPGSPNSKPTVTAAVAPSVERDVPPQYRGARPLKQTGYLLDNDADPFTTSRVPSPPPTVSAFPATLQRFQSMSSIADSDTTSIYSQMSMSRSNTLVRDRRDVNPSLATVAERLANENGLPQTPTPKISHVKSIKGKEKAIPEEDGEVEASVEFEYPVITVDHGKEIEKPPLRKLPTPPSPPTPAVRRPLPIASRETSNSTTGSATSTTATDGSVSLFFSDTFISHSSVKRTDTIAIANLLQSRARRHSDAAYVALYGSQSDDGMYSSPSSSQISLEASNGPDDQGKGQDKVETRNGAAKKQIGQDPSNVKVPRNPISPGKSLKRIAVPADRLEGVRGGRPPPLGPRNSIRPRAISGSSILSGGVTNNFRVKPRLVQANKSAATSMVSLPHTAGSDGQGRSRRGSEGEGDEGGRFVGWNSAPVTATLSPTPRLPPIPRSPSLYPLTGAFGLSTSPSNWSPETPSHLYEFNDLKPFLKATTPLNIGGRRQPR